jgi:hypothetical protein
MFYPINVNIFFIDYAHYTQKLFISISSGQDKDLKFITALSRPCIAIAITPQELHEELQDAD